MREIHGLGYLPKAARPVAHERLAYCRDPHAWALPSAFGPCGGKRRGVHW